MGRGCGGGWWGWWICGGGCCVGWMSWCGRGIARWWRVCIRRRWRWICGRVGAGRGLGWGGGKGMGCGRSAGRGSGARPRCVRNDAVTASCAASVTRVGNVAACFVSPNPWFLFENYKDSQAPNPKTSHRRASGPERLPRHRPRLEKCRSFRRSVTNALGSSSCWSFWSFRISWSFWLGSRGGMDGIGDGNERRIAGLGVGVGWVVEVGFTLLYMRYGLP